MVKQRFICYKCQEGCLCKILRIKPNYLISLILRRSKFLLPPADEVLGKVKFLHLSVCPRRGRGGRYIMMSLPVMDNINWKSVPPMHSTSPGRVPPPDNIPHIQAGGMHPTAMLYCFILSSGTTIVLKPEEFLRV